MAGPRVSIFARYPEPGTVKTRLIPALGAHGAARLYSELLEGTVREARASGLPFQLRMTGAAPAHPPAPFDNDVAIVAQGEGDLGARMARVPAPCIIIGSDCPDLDADILRQAAKALESTPVVLGPARDGGYYLIALRQPLPFLFEDMAWSTPEVLAETLRRLRAHGSEPVLLPELSDVDEPADLERLGLQ